TPLPAAIYPPRLFPIGGTGPYAGPGPYGPGPYAGPGPYD
ncbi:8380_t:CDS:1, partial [Ambispora gerdemannii]